MNLLVNNDLSWNTHIENVIKNVTYFFSYYLELKYFCLFKTENGLTMLTFFPILMFVVLFWVVVLQSLKTNLQKRAILDVGFTVPSETMFTQLK